MIRKAIATASLLGFAGLGLAAPALADAADDRFLNELARYNIHSSKGDADLIAAGHEVCARVNSGDHVLNLVSAISISGHGPYVAGNLVSEALKAYCPQNAYMIEDILAEPGMAGNIQLGPDSAIGRFEQEDQQRQQEVLQGRHQDGWYPGCNTTPMC
jgi:hypothetical protein